MEQPTKSESILKLLGPVILSTVFGVVAAWGTSQFIAGQREQRIQSLEYQLKELQLKQEQNVTRQELKLFMDNASSTLIEIKADIRELRNQVRR